MKYRNAPRKTAQRRSLLLTFLLLLSIPVFVFGVLQDSNFDIRNMAFEDVEVSPETPCVISFPNVNPYSLEVGKSVRVQVDAMSTTLGIKALSVNETNGEVLLKKTYDTTLLNTTETFSFTPSEAKGYELKGLMIDINEKSYACIVSSPYDIKGIRAITDNSKPTFTTLPKESKPSQDIKTDVTYEYTLVATDIDGDTINYFYSFTPGSNWLKPTVIEDGSNGKLTLKFKGSTSDAASYLANIFIHDGYSKHLSSQSWVISVSPESNDNPVVRILEPINDIEIKDTTPIKISWDATDQNHIIKFQLYLSSNPANESTWIKINENIPYNQTSYNINTDNIKDGTYKAVLVALDNQTPAGKGIDISGEIVLAKGGIQPSDDDKVELPEPQVINVSPGSSDEVGNSRPTIKASLIASEGSNVNEETIVVKLDSVDITDSVSFNKISDSEYTVIYLPQEDLEGGLHKVEVTFEDSAGLEVYKEWTFTIQSTQTDDENFHILGYDIPKRTAIIVAAGIGLILLAIVVPIIIFAVWKDQSEDTVNTNPTLPPSLPTTDVESVPLDIPQNDVKPLVTEEVFQAPEPEPEVQQVEQNTPSALTQQPEVIPAVEIPEPTDDLAQIYSQIKELEEEETAQNSPTPPEPNL